MQRQPIGEGQGRGLDPLATDLDVAEFGRLNLQNRIVDRRDRLVGD
jgi:hypothetical protein